MTASRKEDRKRTLLLMGILAVLLGTVVVQLLFKRRREAAVAAQRNSPEARARQALADADRATVVRDLPVAYQALTRARDALDEVLAAQPGDPAVQRSRLVVARRLANVADQDGHPGQAGAHFEDALRRATALFEAERMSDRARLDLLTAAREVAAFRQRRGEPGPAGEAVEAAARAVEATLKGLTPTTALRAALADSWQAAAEAHGAARLSEPAVAAAKAAVAHAQALVTASDQTLNAMGRLTQAAGDAARLADSLGHPEAEALEEAVIRIVRARLAGSPEPDTVRRTLSIWLAHRAERVKATDDAGALAALTEAVALRGTVVTNRPKDTEAREEWVRALNAFGAFHSEKGRDAEALVQYAAAAEAAKGLPGDGARIRLIAMGNHAHLLGRLDKIVESRAVAGEAWALAKTLLSAAGAARAKTDAARAGLRYARVLRADPKPQRAPARAVVAEALALLTGEDSPRAVQIRTALLALKDELGG